MTTFQLQFNAAELPALAKRYGYSNDDNALAAGRRIRAGEFTCKNLLEIFKWKTGGRGKSRLKHNKDEEIVDALRRAVSAETERAAIAVRTAVALRAGRPRKGIT
jgi:hypothetical protein